MAFSISPLIHEAAGWDRHRRSNILMKSWQIACSRQMLFGESQRPCLLVQTVSSWSSWMRLPSKAAVGYGLKLISQALEYVKKDWTTKSFYFYVCLLMHAVVSSWHTACSSLLAARKGRKAANTRLEICPLGNFWNIKLFGGPLAIQDAFFFFFFQEQCFNSDFY